MPVLAQQHLHVIQLRPPAPPFDLNQYASTANLSRPPPAVFVVCVRNVPEAQLPGHSARGGRLRIQKGSSPRKYTSMLYVFDETRMGAMNLSWAINTVPVARPRIGIGSTFLSTLRTYFVEQVVFCHLYVHQSTAGYFARQSYNKYWFGVYVVPCCSGRSLLRT